MENFDNYEKEKKTINIYTANGVALAITGMAAALFGIPFYFIWGSAFSLSLQQSLLFMLLLVVGIIIHELIHGFFFGLFAKNGFKSIRFGVMWQTLTPYCHCKEPLKIKHYFLGALMPALLLGVVPVVISLFNGSGLLLILGVFFTGAAAGDFMVVWILRKEHPETYVQDHPSEAGCHVYRKR
ncbi:DUF3267 domain-containing protein [Proteiniphilum sp. X52]|uniref:DUF3267 domain-containing protein n=1 Tax=Proteiniphilum sp. X52 TaxID=2382159 RepID=UPI000F0A11DA|nr:DUF3267 domain-containing protein [Proteiniphilum sp. X52]RNC65872.1 DUF3267 domain-containing protein [Proteiniphilum sp. X52]